MFSVVPVSHSMTVYSGTRSKSLVECKEWFECSFPPPALAGSEDLSPFIRKDRLWICAVILLLITTVSLVHYLLLDMFYNSSKVHQSYRLFPWIWHLLPAFPGLREKNFLHA